MSFFNKSKATDVECEKKDNELQTDSTSTSSNSTLDKGQHTTKRTLNARTLHLIAMGGSIGTGLFVTISTGLLYGGPLGLFLAFSIWTTVIFSITASIGEMVCYLPVSSPFIQMAGRCVDEAFEVIVGFNYFIMTAVYIPFEITAVNGMIHYWRDDYSPAITFCLQIFVYTVLNLFAVKWFGESEFYLTIGKVFLAIALIFFTFITMVGGNPQHDAFGFRYWQTPGLLSTYITIGSMGRFHGFMAALNKACFTIVGPEYLSMIAGEAGQETRKVLAGTFRTVFYRLTVFYVFGALSVGILLPYNDPTLNQLAASGSTANGSYSPYIIAMNNMGIKVFPHIVNALCVASAFSAGNSYVYCASRALYSISLRGYAPKFFQYCTSSGVPIFCVGVAFLFSLLSLLQLGDNTAKVLTWIVNLCTGAQILNYFLMTITYFCFWRACNAQGLNRHSFAYTSWCQPYTIIYGFVMTGLMVGVLGYTVFMPGHWNIENFLTYYLMVFLNIVIFIAWKLIKRTKMVKPEEADLTTGLAEVEEHELAYLESLQREGKYSENKGWLATIKDLIF
ncbi:CYFA0S16e01706g1_1 [Cyberlindnera fabianii]|uniref:CYFA0S16e01706g1_1 n=1 Tax=Cyberlindnera fabianii TaxID=36022 RepID=A0A061B563_CYBFA|nr:General amino acid permease AGP2 [Cyberlindnera fabianii]CDR45067.1 CYFA0S16e01706g1_1 [Cyberlindnera fabianii]